ncbi:MAG: hypothetical protein KAG06_01290 [Methylococcales bacterium]|nr:hypothetical protein [Methylococcales bacterium]
MNYLRTILTTTACGIAMTAAHAEPAYDTSTKTLTLPFVEILTGQNSNSFADAKLKWHPTRQYFTLDGLEIFENKTKGKVVIGNDANSIGNIIVQPTDPAQSGSGKNQSLNFGDIVMGGYGNDILIGGLGIDVIMGKAGHDILIGGTEDFNPENRDRAFGDKGNDAFIWAPGDGSDYFNGGAGTDVVIFGKLQEKDGEGSKFTVEKDQNFDGIFLDPTTGLPTVDVTGSPGFCSILDSSNQDANELKKLGVDHLVRFALRGVADKFDSQEQTTDNGVRVTLHLKDVEYVVCTTRQGGEFEIFDIRQQPAVKAQLSDLPQRFQDLVK